MIDDPSFWCILSSAVYTFSYHGRSGVLFFLWSSIVVGVHLYHISYIRSFPVVTLMECYESSKWPEPEILFPLVCTVLALTRFLISFLWRFCFSSSSSSSSDREDVYKSLMLDRDRCETIERKLGKFPLGEFVRGVRVKKLIKGTDEYRDYCREFLTSYEKVL